MIFLTCNDAPSGIFKSQVIDVVALIAELFDPNIRLVAFISLRKFRENKKWIKTKAPNALVFPMFPKLKNWKLNALTLFFVSFFVNTDIIIARGVFAANIALKNKKRRRTKKVCYDGRGAVSAEVSEYSVIHDKALVKTIPTLEKKAVLQSDTRIAVTNELVRFWEREFGYERGGEVVIPCTVSASKPNLTNVRDLLPLVLEPRKKLGWGQYDIVLIYSGSVAGWQSFGMLEKMFSHFAEKDSRVKILFLSPEDEAIVKLKEKYPDQVKRMWVAHDEVPFYLAGGDFGIMIREDSVTNQVASPTKFAEYLMAGLKIICSGNIGDYSAFVRKHECGGIVNEENYKDGVLTPGTTNERARLMQLGYENFSKESRQILDSYQALFKNLMNLPKPQE